MAGALACAVAGASVAGGIPVVLAVHMAFASTSTSAIRGRPLCDAGTVTDDLIGITDPDGLPRFHVHQDIQPCRGEE